MVSGYTLTTFLNVICTITAVTKVKVKATTDNKQPKEQSVANEE